MEILKGLVDWGRRIKLLDPKEIPANELQKDAYAAGYAAGPFAKNPHRQGSAISGSWEQGKRERARDEQSANPW